MPSSLLQQTGNKTCEHNLLTACEQTCNNLFADLLQLVRFYVCSCCNKFGTSCLTTCNKLDGIIWHYQTCYKVVLTSLIQSWYNKNVTRLTTRGCNNTVISWLYRTCWNNLATSLIMSSNLLQELLTACSKLVDNLGQAVRTQLVDGLLARCEIRYTDVGWIKDFCHPKWWTIFDNTLYCKIWISLSTSISLFPVHHADPGRGRHDRFISSLNLAKLPILNGLET
jgi:hypothetical protein